MSRIKNYQQALTPLWELLVYTSHMMVKSDQPQYSYQINP